MHEHIPTLGARFDLNKIGEEQNCWQVFWRAVRPEQITGAQLYEGNIHRDDYCIAVQSTDPAVVDFVKHSLEVCGEFKQVCCEPPFILGDDCTAISLPRTGRIDGSGNLIGDDKRFQDEQVLAPVEIEDTLPSIDVLNSLSPIRERPASERTKDLPDLETFQAFEQEFRARFTLRQPGFDRDLWISPKELCDVVEQYADLLEIGLSDHHTERTENALRVRVFPKDGHLNDKGPIELEGLYMFKSRYAVTQFLNSFVSTPRYSDALPDLAGIVGRFHLHFGEPRDRAEADYSQEEHIAPAELWFRLHRVMDSFGEELLRAAESLNRRRAIESAPFVQPEVPEEEREPEPVVIDPEALEAKRREREEKRREEEQELAKRRAEIELEAATQEIRRTQGRCIFCGKPLGFAEKLKKADRHKDCWEYIGE